MFDNPTNLQEGQIISNRLPAFVENSSALGIKLLKFQKYKALNSRRHSEATPAYCPDCQYFPSEEVSMRILVCTYLDRMGSFRNGFIATRSFHFQ